MGKLPDVVVFDWGDTLMKTDPRFSGAMVEWPEVYAVPGAAQALDALAGTCRLVVATNASDSDREQIRAALQRVKINEPIEQIFTMRQLGARKPDTGFFRALELALGVRREQVVMVGDDYAVDIIGAWRAGWRSIWYNPAHRAAPALLPLHTAEVASLAELPQALSGNLDLPDYQTCLAWYLHQATPRNLLNHVDLVAAVSYQMAVWLSAAGEPVNPVLAHRGGMLHDLAKITAKEERSGSRNHADAAADMLLERGQTELAEIARRHLLFGLFEENRQPGTWEEKVVYFADKLAEGSSLVSADERLTALQQRYTMDPRAVDRLRPALLDLQAELCEAMKFPAGELIPHLQQALGQRVG